MPWSAACAPADVVHSLWGTRKGSDVRQRRGSTVAHTRRGRNGEDRQAEHPDHLGRRHRVMALRVDNGKCTFMEQRAHGLNVWREPLVSLRAPKLYNLRSDPFERGDEDGSVFYDKWMADRCSCRPRRWLGSSSKPPRNSGRASGLPASASTRRWRRHGSSRRRWPRAAPSAQSNARGVEAAGRSAAASIPSARAGLRFGR